MIKTGKRAILTLLICALLATTVHAVDYLIPAGQIVGLELGSNQVTVADFDKTLSENARAAGLKVGDQITHVDGKSVTTPEDVRNALMRSGGTVTIRFLRGGQEQTVEIEPAITPEGPRLGIYLKDGVTGVGTVTYYDPANRTFGTLGHGVSSASGSLVPIVSGTAYKATVISVKKGQSGAPGQLLGAIDRSAPIGALTKNTQKGIFGKADQPFSGTPVPLADPEAVHTGGATILSTVRGQEVREYSVEILKIYPKAKTSDRNMLIRVTDDALLQATGGIVQGMSGSPILQDGKLVGAVTHVLVNDPTTGYGIFIENMLNAAA